MQSSKERNHDVNTIPKLAETFGITVDELMQVKTETKENAQKKDFTPMINMVMKGVALGMGVAVTVLSVLHQLEPNSAMGMLGIGLACLAITQFDS